MDQQSLQNEFLMMINLMNFKTKLMNASVMGTSSTDSNPTNLTNLTNSCVSNVTSFQSPQNLSNSDHASVSNIVNSQQLETSKQPDQSQPSTSKESDKPASRKRQRSLNKTVLSNSQTLNTQSDQSKPTSRKRRRLSSNKTVLNNSQKSNTYQEQESSSAPLDLSKNSNLSVNSSDEENSNCENILPQDDEFSQLSKLLVTATKSRRKSSQPLSEKEKEDPLYKKRRLSNNQAAKKSRDAKKLRDLLTAKRAVKLEEENSKLKKYLDDLRNENQVLRNLFGDELFMNANMEDIDSDDEIKKDEIRQLGKNFKNVYCS